MTKQSTRLTWPPIVQAVVVFTVLVVVAAAAAYLPGVAPQSSGESHLSGKTISLINQ